MASFQTFFPSWWCVVTATGLGFAGVYWGWSNMRNNLRLPWSELSFYFGAIFWMYGISGLLGKITGF